MPQSSRILNPALAAACYPAQPRNRASSSGSPSRAPVTFSCLRIRSVHRAALGNADAATILAAGVPTTHLARAQQLLGRQNKCGLVTGSRASPASPPSLRLRLRHGLFPCRRATASDPTSAATSRVPVGTRARARDGGGPVRVSHAQDAFDVGFDFGFGLTQSPAAPQLTDFDDFALIDGAANYMSPPAAAVPLFEETMALWFGSSGGS
ncbi:hypothetical protein BKA62DRAFT_777564 [Auriculariales sp. MPI-PUGE-AT-0066]|nr:hypothetical protein BKA62DRAFT_777564 [Auriculariales sp. MPI-PUGE-AT-0066]